MKNRVIRTAKRRLPRSTDQADSDEPSAKPVFSGFSLLPTKSSTDTPPSSKPLFNLGGSFKSQTSPTFSFASGAAASSISTTTPSKSNDSDNKSSNFETKLKELNTSVLSCIKGHIDSGKLCILTPIFKDYEKHVDELRAEKKDDKPTASNTNAMPMFSFSAPKSSTAAEITGSAAISTASTQSNMTLPTFSFGKPAPSFGSTAGGSTSGFTFASAIQQASKASEEQKPEGTNGNTEDDENDEPPKVEFVPVVEEESIYSKRCKVFVKDSSDYKDRGTGTLYLKKVKDDKIQLIVRADTNLGNILLNILLSAAIPAKQLKNNVVLVCIPTPESEPKPKSVLVRVKTADDAAELLTEIQKYQK